MFDITALGEILIDFTPSGIVNGIPQYAQNPGGAPVNVLVQSSLLGSKTAFISKVGNDSFGFFLRKVLLEQSIDSSGLRFSDSVHTTLAFVHLSDTGERSFSFYRNPGADVLLNNDDVDPKLIQNSRIFHFGSLSLTSDPARSATDFALKTAADSGCIISFDPNYRAPLWASEPSAVSEILSRLHHVNLLKLSDDELSLLTGCSDPEEGTALLQNRYNLSLICVTLGKRGAFFRCGNTSGFVPGFPVVPIDTTGAGDAFWGAVLSQLKNRTVDEIRSMQYNELVPVIRFANAAGALAVTAKGAIPSFRGKMEINRFLMQKTD